MAKAPALRVEYCRYEEKNGMMPNVAKGDIAVILDEAIISGKFNKYQCTIELEGEKGQRRLSLNGTTYNNLQTKFGDDTINWINKRIECLGKIQCGQMMGWVWDVVK